jgi:N utilization substance protein A
LFELEVPEVASGAVEIKGIAREAGHRSKVAVASNQDGVDPVGSCVGQKGVRVQAITNELNGEKLDLILWSPDAARFIVSALSPAKAIDIEVDQELKEAKVTVLDDQLSLAIGKEGQNVRLAAKLTGYRIDIMGETEAMNPVASEVTPEVVEAPADTEETIETITGAEAEKIIAEQEIVDAVSQEIDGAAATSDAQPEAAKKVTRKKKTAVTEPEVAE